ncbi:hypothetical protein K461DRAFT_292494 [Myriangium duriaei CBS 260.36]|uniref:Uncharacterized protein n=1 Tax=Myriangium duriaei CBS 260.36 TaxID=1168546 RepID=A0A9P4J272_9PEZI|nr:hypothetical protein K461DRAFT_292494 [Myriangium duriaei CBS 260.36]
MAPDLNSVPASPRQQRARLASHSSSAANSRRPSQVLPPHGPSPGMPHSPIFAHSDQSGMPLRHPQPMTAAELHLELEKEQEAVVNRLTRELSALRAQHSASVASNHSITSTSSTTPSLLPIDPADPNPTHQITGPTHPTPSRRHRSSSNASIVSGRGLSTSTSSASAVHPASMPHHGQSQASADRAAAATGTSLSRNPSISASGTSTPARQVLTDYHSSPVNLSLPHRPSLSQAVSFTSQNTSSTHATHGSLTSPYSSITGAIPTSAPHHPPLQYGIDADRARAELETVKQENEALKDKIRSLERALRQRRRESGASDISSVSGLGASLAQAPSANAAPRGGPAAATHAQSGGGGVNVSAWAAGAGSSGAVPRDRSQSQSTDLGARRPQEDRDDVVKVGESAGNSGLR